MTKWEELRKEIQELQNNNEDKPHVYITMGYLLKFMDVLDEKERGEEKKDGGRICQTCAHAYVDEDTYHDTYLCCDLFDGDLVDDNESCDCWRQKDDCIQKEGDTVTIGDGIAPLRRSPQSALRRYSVGAISVRFITGVKSLRRAKETVMTTSVKRKTATT